MKRTIVAVGSTGYVHTPDARTVRLRTSGEQPERELRPAERPATLADPFAYFRAVIRGAVRMDDADLSALPNNLTVMRILEAAKESARTGRTVGLSQPF